MSDEKQDSKLNIVETIAPIPLETLKQYFEDKNIFFLIDYDKSILKGERLLTYLGNLEIPCDIFLQNEENFKELYPCYLKHSQIVSIPLFEHITIDLLLEKRGLLPDYHAEYLELYDEDLSRWEDILESLLLFNFYTIDSKEMKDFVTTNHPNNDTDSLEGINFVSLLKYEFFYDFYNAERDKLPIYYSKYFNEYMFKGNNLFHYWANDKNIYYLNLCVALSNEVDGKEIGNLLSKSYLETAFMLNELQKKETSKEFKDVTLV